MENYKKINRLHGLKFISLQASLDIENKKRFFNNRWRFSKKVKGLIVFAIVAVLLISVFDFIPKQGASTVIPQNTATPTSSLNPTPTETETPSTTKNIGPGLRELPDNPQPASSNQPKPLGVLASATVINSSVWKAVANNAWQYYQYNNGVNATTGLPLASWQWPYFTDWDLGDYVQAILDAQNISLISVADASSRLNTVLTFLETRPLTNQSLPYWWYQSWDGNYSASLSSSEQFHNGNVADAGNLLVALKNVELYNSSLTSRIDKIVKVTTNYTQELSTIPGLSNSVNIYDYYVASGFAGFWPQYSTVASQILNNIINSPTVTTYNVSLPMAKISCAPLLMSVFDLPQPNQNLLNLTQQVYLAHEAFYNATGQYRAFGEGGVSGGDYVWEWVVLPSGQTWAVTDESGANYTAADVPIIYTDAAFSFLSLYNTTYALNLSVYVENTLPVPSVGYYDGVQEDGGMLWSITNNENGMILSAARYAIENNP